MGNLTCTSARTEAILLQKSAAWASSWILLRSQSRVRPYPFSGGILIDTLPSATVSYARLATSAAPLCAERVCCCC